MRNNNGINVVKNSDGVDVEGNLPRELLVDIYHNIKKEKLWNDMVMYEAELAVFHAARIAGWLEKVHTAA